MIESMADGASASRKDRAAFSKPAAPDDRLPPHSPEAEQGVLGCILLSPSDCISQCVLEIKAVEYFYDLRHQEIYQAMLDMFDKQEAIDLITLQQKIKDRSKLDMVGGLSYLAMLSDTVPSAANLPYYLDILVEKHQLRRMIDICTKSVSLAYENEGECQKLIENAERELLSLIAGPVNGNIPIKVAVRNAINTIESYHQNHGIHGIASGFVDLD